MMALQHQGLSAKLRVPQAHGPVRARRGQAPAVEAEVHAVDAAHVPFKAFPFNSVGLVLDIPNDDLSALVAGGQAPAIAAEREAAGMIVRALQKRCWLLSLWYRLDNYYVVVRITNGERAPVRTEGGRGATSPPIFSLRP